MQMTIRIHIQTLKGRVVNMFLNHALSFLGLHTKRFGELMTPRRCGETCSELRRRRGRAGLPSATGGGGTFADVACGMTAGGGIPLAMSEATIDARSDASEPV